MPSSGNCNVFIVCYQADVRIVDTAGVIANFSPYLTIVLHVDAPNIKKGANINSVVIQYTDEYDVVHIVGKCASPTTPNTNGVPCIAKATHHKNKNRPELLGDFVWELINTKNGGFNLF
jgi:hypothetical protein